MRAALYGVTTALLLLSSGAAVPPAVACGFDGLLGDGFSAEHPKSISVAFAIGDAVAAGSVDRTAIAPIVPGSRGYWRAAGRVSSLQRLLASGFSNGTRFPNISVLLIDSKLWSRLISGPAGFETQVHTSGASPEDVVIVTSEAILATVLDGQMEAQKAFDLGVIAVDGVRDDVEAVRNTIVAAMAHARDGVVAGIPAAPVRLLGSVR